MQPRATTRGRVVLEHSLGDKGQLGHAAQPEASSAARIRKTRLLACPREAPAYLIAAPDQYHAAPTTL